MNKTISEALSEAKDLISMIQKDKDNLEKQKELEKAEQYLLYIPELIQQNKNLNLVRLKHPKTLAPIKVFDAQLEKVKGLGKIIIDKCQEYKIPICIEHDMGPTQYDGTDYYLAIRLN